MNEEKMRAEFEARFPNADLTKNANGEYFYEYTQYVWTGWQAALSAKSGPEDRFEEEINKRKLQAYPKLAAFFQKHALGSKMKPSCFKCGKADNEIAIRHLELPDIYICKVCAAPQVPTDGDRVRELEKDAARYRWILYNAEATDALWKYGIPSKIALTEKHISNAIDQAIASMSSGEQG